MAVRPRPGRLAFALLVVTYTDNTSKASATRVRYESLYDGETYTAVLRSGLELKVLVAVLLSVVAGLLVLILRVRPGARATEAALWAGSASAGAC